MVPYSEWWLFNFSVLVQLAVLVQEQKKKKKIFPLWRSQIIIFFKVRNCVRVFFCQYCSQAYLVKLLSGLGLFYSPYTVVQAQHGGVVVNPNPNSWWTFFLLGLNAGCD